MTFSVTSIDIDNRLHFSLLKEFCSTIELTEANHPASVNMQYTNWNTNNASLLYLCYTEKRLVPPTGNYYLLCEGNCGIAGSGVYIKDNVAVLLARTWTFKEYRTQYLIHEYLLPKQLEWAKSRGVKSAIITVNEYNKGLLTIFKRAQSRDHHPMSKWYKNAIINDIPEIIQHTPQWTVTFNLD
jgi:hypothetical protein